MHESVNVDTTAGISVLTVCLLALSVTPSEAAAQIESSGRQQREAEADVPTESRRPVDSLRSIGLGGALRLFSENNLSLRLAKSRIRAVEGEATQTAAYPNPSVQMTHEPLWRNGSTQSETYLHVNQELEWSGRSARIEAARRSTDAIRAEVAADSSRLALKVARTYVDAAAAETRLGRLEQVTSVFRQADSSMAEREVEGDASGYAVRRIGLERARYEQRLAAARLDARSARRQLAFLILPEKDGSVAADALPRTRPPSISERTALRTAFRQRSELRRWRSEVEAQRAALRAARQEAWPDPSVTAGYKRQSNGFEGAFLGVSLPLPIFNRNQGGSQAESARLRGAQAQQSLARRQIRNEVRRAHTAYASARHQSKLIGDELLTGTEDLLRIAQTSYGEGEMSLVELLDAADAYRDARITSITLHAELWTRYFELLRAMGRPLRMP